MPDTPRLLDAQEATFVYDNYGSRRAVADFLNDLLPEHAVARVVSGYFYLSALGCIADSLQQWLDRTDPPGSMRLLIGQETDRPTRDAILAALAHDYERAATVPHGELLVELIERGRLEVAVYTLARLHGKVYLLLARPLDPAVPDHLVNGSALWGSSNFTAPGIRAGLSGNLEFNAFSREPHVLRSVHEWFDIRWDEARQGADITADVLHVARGALQRFHAEAPAGPTPFEVYLRALQEVHDVQQRRAPAGDVTAGLANFQKSAVTQAVQVLGRSDDDKNAAGFFVCDGTGLGKTYVAMAVMKHFLQNQGRVLLLAPAAGLRLTWQVHLAREGLLDKVRGESLHGFGDAARPPAVLAQADQFDLVVIDESHHLRNRDSTRYKQVQALCRGPNDAGRRKRLLLLTATPLNNRIDDLLNQIYLFADAGADLEGVRTQAIQATKESYRDLGEIFHDPERRQDSVPELLSKIMVRRERWAVLEYYVKNAPEEAKRAGGRPLAFLDQPPPRPLRYTLTGFDPAIYTKIEKAFRALHLPDIRVTNYLPAEAISEELANRGAGNEVLIIQGLLKRLESSVHAFHVSLERQVAFYEAFLADLEAGEQLRRGALLSRRRWAKDEEEEEVSEPLFDVSRYDAGRAAGDARDDLDTLRGLLKLIARLDRAALDPKLATLRQQMEGFVAGRKVLIFTEFVDTAEYLFEQLGPGGRVALVTGRAARHADRPGREASVDAVVRAFAPRANPAPEGPSPQVVETVDVLVSTDLLAEGQNFQDCNIVINYDLAWNPVRIIQRVGRINRVDSGLFHPPEDQQAHVLVFFPEDELTGILDECLTVVQKNRDKLLQIAEIVGHSTPVIFEDEHTTRILFDQLAEAQSASVYRELEQGQASRFGLGAAFDDDEILAQEYRRLAAHHPETAARVRAYPLPVISCRSSADGPPGVVGLYREQGGQGERLRWLWLPAGREDPAVTDKVKGLVLKQLRCLPRSLRRPLSADMGQAGAVAQAWLADNLRRAQEARQMAIPPARLAGKSSFTKLGERLETEVVRLKAATLAAADFQAQVTRVNEWLGAVDQLVFAQRDAAAAEVDKLLERRCSTTDLLAAAAALSERYPVVVANTAAPPPLFWQMVCAEEIRVEGEPPALATFAPGPGSRRPSRRGRPGSG